MPTVKLTDAAVKRYRAAPGERIDYFDAMLPGFGIRVSGPSPRNPSGSNSWILMYRYGGTKKRFTIEPSYPALGLADARREARDALQRLAKGEDPAITRRAAEQKAQQQARDTIEAVIDQFMVRYMEAKKRAPRYIAETRRLFDLHVIPAWRGRAITSIARRDVVALLDKIVDRGTPIAANRVLAAISKLFNWAVTRDLIQSSPVVRIDKPGAENKRTRVLTDAEIRLVWSAAEQLPYPKGPYFQLLLATAQRREEVATMRWEDIHEADALWMMPADANKPERTHAVPLSRLALELIERCPRTGRHVFTSRSRRGANRGERHSDAPISGYSKAKVDLDKVIAKLAAENNNAAPASWTIHDLRRTAATTMGKLGVSRFIQKRVLNHADNDVTGVYDRYEYLVEKRRALDVWARYLEHLQHGSAPA